MPSYYENIYYFPEKFGLEILGEVEFLGAYEFDTFVVWREKATGRLGYGEDSGCSCPSPFEDFEPEEIAFAERGEIVEALQAAANKRRLWGRSADMEVANLIDKVINA